MRDTDDDNVRRVIPARLFHLLHLLPVAVTVLPAIRAAAEGSPQRVTVVAVGRDRDYGG